VSGRGRRRKQRRHPYEEAWDEGAQRQDYYQPAYPGYYTQTHESPYPDEGYWEDEEPVRLISLPRVLLAVLALVAGGVAFFGFLDRSALQLPIIVVGLLLLGVVLLVLSLSLARVAARLGGQGSGGRALWGAFLGGVCILGAAGALSGAIVLGMVIA
jgi:hypothetical protein